VTTASTTARKLEPGTSGWTACDLDDPQIAEQWDRGRFEIVHGILKKMPPADFVHGEVVIELLTLARAHLPSSPQTVFKKLRDPHLQAMSS
jgi:hypothetical protein